METIPVLILCVVFVLHWFADFVLQTDWMALNKSKQWPPLLTHTFVYTFVVYVGLVGLELVSRLLGFKAGMMNYDSNLFNPAYFFAFTLAAHTLTDYVTSRITSKLWKDGKRHWFFVVIGADQMLHMFALIYALRWLY